MTKIKWNNKVKLILSDVDETVADVYVKATDKMITELTSVLEDNIILFFITGQGLRGIQWRITDNIPKPLCKYILFGHCSGAEVWGHDQNGDLLKTPFYSIYENTLTKFQKKSWRDLVKKIIKEFSLKIYPTMPIPQFIENYGSDPLNIMYEDRGPQITLEVVNGYNLSQGEIMGMHKKIPETHSNYDLRIPINERANYLFEKYNIPITSRLAGIFAIDFAVKGVSKTTAVKHVLNDKNILKNFGLNRDIINNSKYIEVWGDKFSALRGGTDRHMSEAVAKEVRSIDFRIEDPAEFPPGHNIVLWDGDKHLHEGLLEYLKSRSA